MNKTIGIINYGVGNHYTLKFFFKSLGYRTILSNRTDVLEGVDIIVLPGVGSFKQAMSSIKKNRLDRFIKNISKSNKCIIGICLGAQILLEQSFEDGLSSGLGLIPGKVIPFKKNLCHIGWNEVISFSESEKITNQNDFYFNHSFFIKCPDKYVEESCIFKSEKFPAIVRKENIIGIQFHPEKSQIHGRELIRRFLRNA